MNAIADEKRYLWIALIIPFLTIIDIWMTVVNIRRYVGLYPGITYEAMEMNRIVIWGWNNIGFYEWSIIYGLISVAIITLISANIYKQKLPLWWAGFFLGVYTIVIWTHLNAMGVV